MARAHELSSSALVASCSASIDRTSGRILAHNLLGADAIPRDAPARATLDDPTCRSTLRTARRPEGALVPSAMLAFRAVYETLAISAPTVTDSLRGKLTMEDCDARLKRWATRLLDQARADRRVEGLERIPPDEVFVLMSNHRSLYDVPLLMEAFPRRLRMVTKSELFRVPIWGPAMRGAGFIEVDRANTERAREAMEVAKARLREGTNVWIAPEGTRSRTGELGPFKSGGFHLALSSGLRILPVGIRGTEKILAADGLRVTTGAEVHIAFGDAIDPAPYGVDGRHALSARVREAVLEMLAAG